MIHHKLLQEIPRNQRLQILDITLLTKLLHTAILHQTTPIDTIPTDHFPTRITTNAPPPYLLKTPPTHPTNLIILLAGRLPIHTDTTPPWLNDFTDTLKPPTNNNTLLLVLLLPLKQLPVILYLMRPGLYLHQKSSNLLISGPITTPILHQRVPEIHANKKKKN